MIIASGAFVPTHSMPGWLQGFTANPPLSQAIDADGALLLSQPAGNHVVLTLAWCDGIVGVSVPLASLLFRRKTAS